MATTTEPCLIAPFGNHSLLVHPSAAFYLLKPFVQRDEQSVGLVAIQAYPVVCKIGCLLAIGKQVD